MVKIADVARHASVSASTVSYVLSGKRPISQETRERVQESIRVLGYRPHAGARSLASRRANVIALVVPLHSGVHVPVVMQFATSVVTTARSYDHDVLLLTQDEGERGIQRVAETALADAVIVMDIELQDPRLPVLRSLQAPVVLIGFPSDARGLTCVDLDFAGAGQICVQYLVDQGHRCVGLIGSPPEVYERQTGYATRVAEGFTSAVRAAGIAGETLPCDTSRKDVFRAVEELLRDHPDLTALVIHNEPVIETVLDALRSCGRRVPEDVSVVAICPDEMAVRLDLTAVALPAEQIAHAAVDLVMSKLDGTTAAESTIVPPTLTARGSTCPPNSSS
ncbi:MAG TPA: LacI family DNA-binding transcriptional regulator [Mycobacteriales bacterium]|nr:LacI family DNA-binding transcriptional regulator [Mycobacteriales bacterium]